MKSCLVVGQVPKLGNSQGKGTVTQEIAGAIQKCWPLGRGSSQTTR